MPSLTRAEAAERAALLSIESYAVDLDLTAGEEVFGSVTRVRFRCARPGADTFVEVHPVVLRGATLNGRVLDPSVLAGNRLPLTGLATENELVVRADMAYSNSGAGLHRFTDPADGEVYLHAMSFLDDAQRIFACFDQPDLKAPLTLAVTAPPQWTVLANSRGHSAALGRWVFEPTPPLSTYLMTLVAGPYHGRYAEHDGIPLGLHCRAALAEHLDRDADELFAVTRQCFDRYHELFGVRYAFGKYDQVFVPEFNAGAMENPGCVTLRDDLVFRSAVTEAEREIRAVIVAHEMAHMWFGDLVTLRWWDDVWLNESFAEYLGFRVTVEATAFTGAWTTFTADRKVWGYAADQRPSTHPVAPADVPDTASALLNFDGISYAKGASALAQLVTWLGDRAFFAGLRRFFAAHAYGNATLDDLLAALAEASGRDVRAWADVWLREPRVNTLRPVVSIASDGRYDAVSVVQTAPDAHPVLRPHRVALGLYDRDAAGRLVRHERVEVELDPTVDSGQTWVPALVGVPAAALLLVNDDDLTYAKVRLPEAELALLPSVADPRARAVLWSTAWHATFDAELPPDRFVVLAAAGLPVETSPGVFAAVLDLAATVAVPRYLPPALRPGAAQTLAAVCAGVLAVAEPASGRQLAAARGLVACAGQGEVGVLRGWLGGQGVPDGLAVDADLRWLVLRRLVVLGAAGTADIEAEAARDRSARGAEQAAGCRAALPDAVGKAEAWQAIVDGESLSNRLLLATAGGFWQAEQATLTQSYVDRYFVEMPSAADRRTPQVFNKLAALAYPRFAVAAGTAAAAERMLRRDDLAPGLRRAVLDQTDDLRRALAARALAGG